MKRPLPSERLAAYTLMEILISMTIFSVVLVAAIQATSALTSYDSLATAQDDLQNEGKAIIRRISDDMTLTSWYFPDSLNITAAPSTVTYPMDVAVNLADLRANMASDRGMRYYPFVQLQKSDASAAMGTSCGSLFLQHQRVSSLVRIPWPLYPQSTTIPLLSEVPGLLNDDIKLFDTAISDHGGVVPDTADYQAARKQFLLSYYARSQEIIFLQATASAWKAKAPRKDGIVDADGGSLDFKNDGPPSVANFGGTKNAWRAPGMHETLGIFHPSGWTPVKDGTGVITGYSPRPTEPLNPASASANVEPYGVVMDGGLLQDTSNLQRIGVNWRTVSGTAYAVPPVSDLLEYSYCVVPSRFGMGCLVRAKRVSDATAAKYKHMNPAAGEWAKVGSLVSSNNDDGMIIDQILSDNVVRVVFETYRTSDSVPNVTAVTSLDINQIKVRIYMVRRIASTTVGAPAGSSSTGGSGLVGSAIYRMFETVVSMRAQNSSYDKDFSTSDTNSNSSKLGATPVGVRF